MTDQLLFFSFIQLKNKYEQKSNTYNIINNMNTKV